REASPALEREPAVPRSRTARPPRRRPRIRQTCAWCALLCPSSILRAHSKIQVQSLTLFENLLVRFMGSANHETGGGHELFLVAIPRRLHPRGCRSAVLHRMPRNRDDGSRREVLQADAGTAQAARTFGFETPGRHGAIRPFHV